MSKFEAKKEKIEKKNSVKKHSTHQTDIPFFQSKIENSIETESDSKLLHKAQTHVPQNDDKMKDNDQEEEQNELICKFAAIVLDRFFFYLTLIYAIITFVALLLSIPNFYK